MRPLRPGRAWPGVEPAASSLGPELGLDLLPGLLVAWAAIEIGESLVEKLSLPGRDREKAHLLLGRDALPEGLGHLESLLDRQLKEVVHQ